jgi:hypothetical protein
MNEQKLESNKESRWITERKEKVTVQTAERR